MDEHIVDIIKLAGFVGSLLLAVLIAKVVDYFMYRKK